MLGDVLQTMCIFLDAFESASGPDPCEEHNGTHRKGPDVCFDNNNDVSLTQARLANPQQVSMKL